MAKSLNRLQLIGNVGRDPEVKVFEDGRKSARFSLATAEPVKDGDTWKDETEWHACVVRGPLVEVVERYVQKGKKLYVEGPIRTRAYTDRDGAERKVTEVRVSSLLLLGDRQDAGGPRPGSLPPLEPPPPKKPAEPSAQGLPFDDDLPF